MTNWNDTHYKANPVQLSNSQITVLLMKLSPYIEQERALGAHLAFNDAWLDVFKPAPVDGDFPEPPPMEKCECGLEACGILQADGRCEYCNGVE